MRGRSGAGVGHWHGTAGRWRGAACGGVAVAWWWTRALACALLCAVAGDNGAGMAAVAEGGALVGGIAGRVAGVGRRVVAWWWRGGVRGLWRACCFALLQVTTGPPRAGSAPVFLAWLMGPLYWRSVALSHLSAALRLLWNSAYANLPCNGRSTLRVASDRKPLRLHPHEQVAPR